MKKEPTEKPIGGESLQNGKVIERGGFKRSEVFRIDSNNPQAQRCIGVICNLKKDGLYSAMGDWNPKDLFAFTGIGDGCDNFSGGIGLFVRTIQMSDEIRIGFVRGQEDSTQ